MGGASYGASDGLLLVDSALAIDGTSSSGGITSSSGSPYALIHTFVGGTEDDLVLVGAIAVAAAGATECVAAGMFAT